MNSISGAKMVRGRPKGTKNKVSVDLKGMILKALKMAGGYTYLHKIALEQPGHCITLLSMIVPHEVSHSGVLTGVSVQIQTNVALGSARVGKARTDNQEQYIPQEVVCESEDKIMELLDSDK